MSNKRNPRRGRQRKRSEVDRKPKKLTKAMADLAAMTPIERERKNTERMLRKATAQARRRLNRMRVSGKPRKIRKPRTKYGNTFWSHSHDV